jgi:hypothetical protein
MLFMLFHRRHAKITPGAVGGLVAALAVLLSPRLAHAQVLCATSEIGSPCSAGGTCIEAACNNVPADGGAISGPCALCAAIPGEYCRPEQFGTPCGDGGFCRGMGAGGSGATLTDSGSSFSYAYATCESISGNAGMDAGAGNRCGADGSVDAGSSGQIGPPHGRPTGVECLVADTGQTCDMTRGRVCASCAQGETCLAASCVDDGSTRSCAECVDLLGATYCPPNQTGAPCGDGGSCLMFWGGPTVTEMAGTAITAWSFSACGYPGQWTSGSPTCASGHLMMSGGPAGGFDAGQTNSGGSSGTATGGSMQTSATGAMTGQLFPDTMPGMTTTAGTGGTSAGTTGTGGTGSGMAQGTSTGGGTGGTSAGIAQGASTGAGAGSGMAQSTSTVAGAGTVAGTGGSSAGAAQGAPTGRSTGGSNGDVAQGTSTGAGAGGTTSGILSGAATSGAGSASQGRAAGCAFAPSSDPQSGALASLVAVAGAALGSRARRKRA